MHVQDVRTLDDEVSISADVCIVGSGPAGLTLARELGGTGARVVVLESGGLERDPWADALSVEVSVGAPRQDDVAVARNRVVGGSSATWWGRLATFDEVDLAHRDWVPHSGWPVKRAELESYFARSLSHVGGTVADNEDAALVDLVAADFPGLDPAVLRPYAWTHSRDAAHPRDSMRFGPRALTGANPGVRCLTHATVVHVDTNAAGDSVEGVEVRAPDGTRRWVRARHVVLAAGGIENARLLLASNRIVRTGLGNAHDVVGRFLMDHPRGTVAQFAPTDLVAAQRVFGEHRLRTPSGSTRVVPGLAASPTLQERERLLNCAFWIETVVAEDDPLHALQALGRRERPLRAAASVLRRPGPLLAGVPRTLRDRRGALRRASSVNLMCILEQVPDPDSRITLGDRRDALGVPLPVVDWRASPEEARTARTVTRALAAELRRLGLPVPRLLPMVAGDGDDFWLSDAFHPMGATRMSDDPRTGVVDRNCAVHGVRGLHVAGSSVFPTSGHANPTQMIVTLAVRLADRIQDLLAERDA